MPTKKWNISLAMESDLLWTLYSPKSAPLLSDTDRADCVQHYRERLVSDVSVLLEWVSVLRIRVLTQWERSEEHPEQCAMDLLAFTATRAHRLQEWVQFIGVVLATPSSVPPEQTGAVAPPEKSGKTAPESVAFFRESAKVVPPVRTFYPERWRLWEPRRVLDNPELMENASFRSIVHLLRSFLTTILEDELLPMLDPSFTTECWTKLRFELEAFARDLLQWQETNDKVNEGPHHRLLRLLRPFTHRIPAINLFFHHTVEKAHVIRLLCLANEQGNRYLGHWANNLLMKSEPELGTKILEIRWNFSGACTKFTRDLSATGLQQLGQHERRLLQDALLTPALAIDPMQAEIGASASRQREQGLRFIQLLFCRITLLWNTVIHEFPLPELLLTKAQAMHTACLQAQTALVKLTTATG